MVPNHLKRPDLVEQAQLLAALYRIRDSRIATASNLNLAPVKVRVPIPGVVSFCEKRANVIFAKPIVVPGVPEQARCFPEGVIRPWEIEEYDELICLLQRGRGVYQIAFQIKVDKCICN